MKTAHVFQHKYTGIQIFIFNVQDELDAKLKILDSEICFTNYVYIGVKIFEYV